MTAADVPAVMALAGRVHPTFPEGEAVIHDRLALFPQGCLVLQDGTGTLAAYAIAYPARRLAPPPLDTVLGALPPGADALYVHDVALAPEWRGRGLAAPAIARFIRLAEPFGLATLVSVYGTAPFWSRFGFEATGEALENGRLASYGEGAVFMTRYASPASARPADSAAKNGSGG